MKDVLKFKYSLKKNAAALWVRSPAGFEVDPLKEIIAARGHSYHRDDKDLVWDDNDWIQLPEQPRSFRKPGRVRGHHIKRVGQTLLR
ncbi:MAG: hypothetical protein ABI813_08910 [Bacteroidota bacterium]